MPLPLHIETILNPHQISETPWDSPITYPDRDSATPPGTLPKFVRNCPLLSQSIRTQNCALNRQTRPESTPARKRFLENRGSQRPTLATQEWLTGNLWLTKSPIISPDLGSRTALNLRREIVRELSDKRQISPWHRSLDRALNRLSRLESLPDSRCSRKGGYCAGHLASHEC
jgi:hypothetical protein